MAEWIGCLSQDQKVQSSILVAVHRNVGQTSHSTLPLPTQQLSIPGGMKSGDEIY